VAADRSTGKTATVTGSGRNVAAEPAYLTRVLKAPSLAASVERLAERARAESWSHEEFLAACLSSLVIFGGCSANEKWPHLCERIVSSRGLVSTVLHPVEGGEQIAHACAAFTDQYPA
jgi:hypothetical protein